MILIITYLSALYSCNDESSQSHQHSDEAMHESAEEEVVHLSPRQFEAIGMKVDSMPKRAMEGFVETNGQLILPPQSQAAVTAIIGANVQSVEVIEGSKINRGQHLAYLYHPDLIKLQTEYATNVNELEYLEQAYLRQEKLYSESVTSGKDFQKTRADFLSKKGMVNGLQAQLKQLGIDAEKVKEGRIYEIIAIKAPITGYIQSVNIRTGQYVSPQDILFEIIHTDHIHAHFKVFESDIQKVKEGQVVQFTIESQPDVQRQATIFAVGKVFESGSKAVNLHAELENKDGALLPGMYARGRVVIGNKLSFALPKDALVMEGDRYFIFQAEYHSDNQEWQFHPLEVSVGLETDDWLEIKSHVNIDPKMQFAWNNAYYLLSEMKKSEMEHHH